MISRSANCKFDYFLVEKLPFCKSLTPQIIILFVNISFLNFKFLLFSSYYTTILNFVVFNSSIIS
jgi:hypothetical protein